jgi:hypothetical protein
MKGKVLIMSMLDFDFNSVPDDFQTIPAGLYNMEVILEPSIEPTKDGSSQNLIVDFAVADENEYKGRTMREWFYLGNELGLIKVKKFLRSCGVDITSSSGINTAELVGKVCKVSITESFYTDKITNEKRTSSRIHSFIVED